MLPTVLSKVVLMISINIVNKQIGAFLFLLLFLVIFGYYCPIEWMIGIPCPGCNMTTSLYWLIRGNLSISLYYHALCIPSIVCGILLVVFRNHKKVFLSILWIWIVCMLIYYFYRMITIFPCAPMQWNDQSCLSYFRSFI